MDNKALFRTSMGGFKKEDVVSYIDKLSKDTNRMLARKDAEIKELNTRVSEAENKASQLEKRCEELEKTANEKTSEASSKDAQIKALSDEIALLKIELEEKSKITQQNQNVTDSQDYKALEQKYNALAAEKAEADKQLEAYRDIEGVQRDLGTILMKAEKSAAEIIAKAKKDAEIMIDEASRISDEITQRRIKACTDIADTFDRSKINMEKAHCDMCEQIEKIKSAVDAFYSSVETGRKVVHECASSVKGIDCKSPDTNNN